MEKEIQNTYKEVNGIRPISVFMVVVFLVGWFVLFCLIWGGPFYRTVEINGMRITFDGWVSSHTWVAILAIILTYIIVRTWQLSTFRKKVKKYQDILFEDCDVVTCLSYIEYGMEYGKQFLKQKRRDVVWELEVLRSLAYLYLQVLTVMKKQEEAIAFYENEWPLEKKPKVILNILKLNLAYVQHDVEAYNVLWKNTPAKMLNKQQWIVQKLMLEGEYEKVLTLLQKQTAKRIYDQVMLHTKFAKCYIKLGQLENAKEHLEFVREHGNTLPEKEKAIESLEKYYNV